MITFKDARRLDLNAQYFGVSEDSLMENAGKNFAEWLKTNIALKNKKILILCGTGNNGGDGFVIARYLSPNKNLNVLLADAPSKIRTPLAFKNYNELLRKNIKVQTIDDIDVHLKKADLLIDALLGIGISGELREPYKSLVEKINELKISKAEKLTIVSVDVPTGLGATPSIKPDITLTFHDIKEDMSEHNSGKIVILPIGIPENAEKFVGPGDFLYYPVPEKSSHKGDNGNVLIIGGGPYTGAPVLSALAALHVGADLIYIATPEEVRPIIAAYSPDLITVPLKTPLNHPENLKKLTNLRDKVDVLLIGPGLGDASDTLEGIIEIIRYWKGKVVVDADAIKGVSLSKECIKGNNMLITPHRGEFLILTGKKPAMNPDEPENDKNLIMEEARKLGVALLVKGVVDVITDGKKIAYNRTGNPGMTVGGTGDVLAGLCAGLISKDLDIYTSAKLAAFLNGYTGDRIFAECSYGLTASRLVEAIPRTLTGILKNVGVL